VEEEGDGRDSACEPLGLGQADDERAEHILHLIVAQALRGSRKGLSSLLTDYGLVLIGKFFEKRKEDSLVRTKGPDTAELFCDSEKHLVVLISNKGYQKGKVRRDGGELLTFEVRDKLTGNLTGANGQDDSLESMNGVNLEVHLFGLHLFFEEGKDVDSFDHFGLV
jgi:hypothetical protein